jgi:glycolate oxidase
MDKSLIEAFEKIVGKENVVVDREKMLNYLVDESPAAIRPKPADDLALVRPADTGQVSEVMRVANEHRVPVFARGGGTGLVGGAVPTMDGVILSLERMNAVEIDRENMMAVAEAGVTLAKLIEEADKFDLSFPPHPGDESAQMGGLAATNAGGSRAVRHGVMRNQIRGLEVVLTSGEILNLGGKLHKNNVGYDLMQLIIGSEGTLAVITKVTVRLYPKSEVSLTLIVPFENRQDALSSVPRILNSTGTPLAIEYVQRDLVTRTAEHLGLHWLVDVGQCYLIIVTSEGSREQVLSQSTKIAEVCKEATTYDAFVAESKKDQDNILRIRSNIYLTLKSETIDILDVTVPVAELEKVIGEVEEVALKLQARVPVYGHAADGNLHVHIMREPNENPKRAESLRNEIYAITTRAGGVITGEHGIGKARIQKLPAVLTRKELELMAVIKRTFDPNDILNPGTKILAGITSE